jgi:hypothetical protein
VTSKLAANALYDSGAYDNQMEAVYGALLYANGATSRELGVFMNMPEVPHRRLPDLRRAGRVRMGEIRMCTVARKLCVTWWVV